MWPPTLEQQSFHCIIGNKVILRVADGHEIADLFVHDGIEYPAVVSLDTESHRIRVRVRKDIKTNALKLFLEKYPDSISNAAISPYKEKCYITEAKAIAEYVNICI